MNKKRLSACRKRGPKRSELRLVEILSREIRRHHYAVHAEIFVAALEFLDAVIEIEHRQPGKGFEPARVLGVSLGERIVQDSAELKNLGAIPFFFDPSSGIRKDADVDSMLIHHVEVLLVIESVEPDTADIVLSVGHKLEKFPGKSVKMSIDDHGVSLREIRRGALRNKVVCRVLIQPTSACQQVCLAKN
jgi:hypothetical protein